jgi:hypothetical protein
LSLIEKGISMSIVDRLRYDGKRALVVGGATGMGAAAAKAVGELGAEVIVLDYAPVDFKVAQAVKVDLRDPASIDAALKQVEGPIHAVFSAAGVADGTTDLLKINFIGHRHLIDRLLAKNQLPNGSAICFISSVAGMGWENDLDKITEFLATPDFAAATAWSEAHEAEGYIHYGTSKKIINTYVAMQGYPLAQEGHSDQRDLPGPDRHPPGPGQRGPMAQLRPGLPRRDRLQGPHPRADGRCHGVPQQRSGVRHQRDHPARGHRSHDGVDDRVVRAGKDDHRPDHGEGQALGGCLPAVDGSSGQQLNDRVPATTQRVARRGGAGLLGVEDGLGSHQHGVQRRAEAGVPAAAVHQVSHRRHDRHRHRHHHGGPGPPLHEGYRKGARRARQTPRQAGCYASGGGVFVGHDAHHIRRTTRAG